MTRRLVSGRLSVIRNANIICTHRFSITRLANYLHVLTQIFTKSWSVRWGFGCDQTIPTIIKGGSYCPTQYVCYDTAAPPPLPIHLPTALHLLALALSIELTKHSPTSAPSFYKSIAIYNDLVGN
jgi:hypothetical protein